MLYTKIVLFWQLVLTLLYQRLGGAQNNDEVTVKGYRRSTCISISPCCSRCLRLSSLLCLLVGKCGGSALSVLQTIWCSSGWAIKARIPVAIHARKRDPFLDVIPQHTRPRE